MNELEKRSSVYTMRQGWSQHKDSNGNELFTKLVPYDPSIHKYRTAECVGPEMPNPTLRRKESIENTFGHNVWSKTYEDYLNADFENTGQVGHSSSYQKSIRDGADRACSWNSDRSKKSDKESYKINIERMHNMIEGRKKLSEVQKETGLSESAIRYHYHAYHKTE